MYTKKHVGWLYWGVLQCSYVVMSLATAMVEPRVASNVPLKWWHYKSVLSVKMCCIINVLFSFGID